MSRNLLRAGYGLLWLLAVLIALPVALGASGSGPTIFTPVLCVGSPCTLGGAGTLTTTSNASIGGGLTVSGGNLLISGTHSLNLGGNGTLSNNSQTYIATSNGVVAFRFNGTTSSYAELKSINTGLASMLADESGYATWEASEYILPGTTVAGLPSGVSGAFLRNYITNGNAACAANAAPAGGGSYHCEVVNNNNGGWQETGY